MASDLRDPERTKQDVNHLTGIDADEERRIELAAHSAHKDTQNQIRELEDQLAAPSAKEPDYGNAENLSQAEESGGGGWYNRGGSLRDTLTDKAKAGAKEKVKGLITPKRAAIGGGILSFLAIFLIMSSGFSAFELINLRENALGHGNRFTNRALQKRRAQSVSHLISNLGKTGDELTEKERLKLKEHFEKQGFKLDFHENGEVKDFSYTDKYGETKHLDFNAEDDVKATNDFFGGDGKFGLEASKAFDRVHATQGALWRGPGARLVYASYKFVFFNWLDRKPSDKAKTNRQKLAENLRQASVTEEATAAKGLKNKQELGDGQKTKDQNGNETSTSVTDGAELMNGEENNNITPEEYQAKMLADPSLTDGILGVAPDSDVESLINDTSKQLDVGGISSEAVAEGLGKGILKGSIKAVFQAFNVLGIAQAACSVKGTLNFVSNVRNIMLAVELARFAVRILNAADDQKAGILSGEALNLVMIYLTTPNPETGKGHTGAGGEQFMFGNTQQRVSKKDVSSYGVGRNNDGILGRINNIVNGIPGIDHCKVVNNGYVQAGGIAVGIVAAVGSGGSITAGEVATQAMLAVLKTIVVQVGTPMLIKTGAHMIANGNENGEQVGDMFASGFDSLGAMVGGGSGLRPIKKEKLVALEADANAYERSVIADQSLYERYLSPSNGRSLATTVAMAMPGSMHAASISFSSSLTGMLHSITNFGILSNLFPNNSAKAAAFESGCTDPQVKALGIATDPFCNTIMAEAPQLNLNATKAILKQNDQIDAQGNPTDTKAGGDNEKSFNEYLALCHSGRPGILYNPAPDKEGNASATDNTCVEDGTPLPGDNVGRYLRFTAWYGDRIDESSILEGANVRDNMQQATFTKSYN